MRPPPVIVGVLNITPDSFSDGGRFVDAAVALAHARQMVGDGATMIDVGGESTRPGSDPTSVDDELRRVIPIVEALAGDGVSVSVDTVKSGVACRAIAAGARMINDVSALRSDASMAETVAGHEVKLCLMHMLGTPKTMQDDPRYDDVVAEVGRFLAERAAFAESRGVRREQIAVDPGIGFGKTLTHNVDLLRGIGDLASHGFPVYIGVSRKRFLGALTGHDEPAARVSGSVAAAIYAWRQGASYLRVHDVRETADALAVEQALLSD